MISVTKFFSFSASHKLPHHEGQCKKLHGHNYRLEVTVTGPINDRGPSQGMIVDFQDLDTIVNDKIISQYDHAHLNDLLINPTAEEMVKEFCRILTTALSYKSVELTNIKLWETEKCYAEWKNTEFV